MWSTNTKIILWLNVFVKNDINPSYDLVWFRVFSLEIWGKETGPSAHGVHNNHWLSIHTSCMYFPILSQDIRVTFMDANLIYRPTHLWEVGENWTTWRKPTLSQGECGNSTQTAPSQVWTRDSGAVKPQLYQLSYCAALDNERIVKRVWSVLTDWWIEWLHLK